MPEALVIVDFQNDFCPGGALPVPDGDAIAGRIDELLDSGRFDLVVATRDWHPADHASFAGNAQCGKSRAPKQGGVKIVVQ